METKQVFTSMTLFVKLQPYKVKKPNPTPLKNTDFWSQSVILISDLSPYKILTMVCFMTDSFILYRVDS